MGHEEVEVHVPVHVPKQHPHTRFGASLGIQRDAEEEGGVGEGPVPGLLPEQVALAVVCHVEVEPSVSGEVVAEDAERRAALRQDPRLAGYVLEGPVAPVPEEAVALVGKALRRAEVGFAGSRNAVPVRIVHEITAHVKVEVGVAVVVAKGRRTGPALPEDGGVHPQERPAATEIEGVLPVVRHEDVGVAVSVDVTDRYAGAVTAVEEPARARVVPKPAVRLLQEEAVARDLGGGNPVPIRRERTRLDQVDVEVPVPVGVKERGPGSHDRGQREPGEISGVMEESDPGSRSHVLEAQPLLGRGGRPGQAETDGEEQAGSPRTTHLENPVSGPVRGVLRAAR